MSNKRKTEKISIIIISKNEGHNLKQTLDHLALQKSAVSYEIIVVDDGSIDHSMSFLENSSADNIKTFRTESLGPSGARNLGAEAAGGELLVFLDAHVITSKDWLDNLAACFEDTAVSAVTPVLGSFNPAHPDVYGVALNQNMQPYYTTKPVANFSPLPFAGAGCLLIRSEVFHQLGGFDQGFIGLGYSDIDFCFRLWTSGFNVYLEPAVRIIHKFRKSKPYHVEPRNITHNLLRMAFKNFKEDRIARVINVAKEVPDFGSILMEAFCSDVWEQRIAARSKHHHDDDWFFEKFAIDL